LNTTIKYSMNTNVNLFWNIPFWASFYSFWKTAEILRQIDFA